MKNRNKILTIALTLSIFYFTLILPNFTYASDINEQKLGLLLNQERSERNLSQLEWNEKLYQAAKDKADHMIKHNYFEHYSPTGETPWDFIKDNNYSYKYAGENLAMDFSTSQNVHEAWMNSITHKENMLNINFSEYAIAAIDGKIDGKETTVVVEYFASPSDKFEFAYKNNIVANFVLNLLLGK